MTDADVAGPKICDTRKMRQSSRASATLVLASYNHARFIPAALASVAAQDHPDLALIVTDDASTDDSSAVIERELLANGLTATKIFHERNAGICRTFNEALAHVRTPYVAFLAADDWMEPDRISKQVAALDERPDAALVYSDMWVVTDDGSAPAQRISSFWGDRWLAGVHGDLHLELVKTNWIPAPTVLSRTDALRRAGGYDESLPYEDYDMWLRLAAHGWSFAYVDDPLVSWRRTPDSLTEKLSAEPDISRNLVDLRIWSKHLGTSRTTDAWLVPHLFHLAVTTHKRGSRSPVVARALRACLRRQPSVATAMFALLSTLTQERRAR